MAATYSEVGWSWKRLKKISSTFRSNIGSAWLNSVDPDEFAPNSSLIDLKVCNGCLSAIFDASSNITFIHKLWTGYWNLPEYTKRKITVFKIIFNTARIELFCISICFFGLAVSKKGPKLWGLDRYSCADCKLAGSLHGQFPCQYLHAAITLY